MIPKYTFTVYTDINKIFDNHNYAGYIQIILDIIYII